MQNWERARDLRELTTSTQLEFGRWLASLADWRYFITLTHRTPTSTRLSYADYTRVGLARHNRMVRSLFYDNIRALDPTARFWGETETHAAGGFHEHALLSCASTFGVYGAMASWFDRRDGGWWDVQPFDSSRAVELAAGYIEKAAKYAGKLAAQPPKVYGFGLLPQASHSLTLPR
jgi:hypothetical protein